MYERERERSSEDTYMKARRLIMEEGRGMRRIKRRIRRCRHLLSSGAQRRISDNGSSGTIKSRINDGGEEACEGEDDDEALQRRRVRGRKRDEG